MKADYVDQEAETTKRAWLHPIVTSTSSSHLLGIETMIFVLMATCKVDGRTTGWANNAKQTFEKGCDQIFYAT